MRLRTLVCLSLVGGVCALAATGFPRRIGLTASQADVSLPGDLLLPGANVVVDRGIAIDAPASVVWDVLGHVFEPADESMIIEIADEDHVLMHVAAPAAPEGAPASGTCVTPCCPCRRRAPCCTFVSVMRHRDANARSCGRAWQPSPCPPCRCCVTCVMRVWHTPSTPESHGSAPVSGGALIPAVL